LSATGPIATNAAPELGDVGSSAAPRTGRAFTGLGTQWPQMGKALAKTFPVARAMIKRLDEALQTPQMTSL
jgi:acyl transferase domain-containing protein